MSKKTVRSLITWAIIIAFIAVAVILLVTVVNKKVETPIFQTDSTGKVLLVYNGKDKEVEVPKEITLIGNSAFENNSSVTKVTFENGSKLQNIARNAFKSCVNLKQVVLPKTVEKISYGAFQDCMRLERITIPASVKTIEENVFSGCSELSEIRLNEGIETIGDGAFASTAIDYIHFPASIKNLGEGVFANCTQLENLSIAENCTLFSYDENLRVLYMTKENTKEIVLVLKTTVEDFTIEDDVTKVHSNAFFSAESIKNLIIPNSVTEIGLEAFAGCTEIKSIKVPFIGTSINSNMAFSSIFGTIPETLTTIEVSQGTKIVEKAFKDLEYVTTITLPTTIEYIDTEAFSGCRALATINNLPTTLTKISRGAFSGCRALRDNFINTLLTPTVEIIEANAFANCTGLNNIVVPETVKSIGLGAFSGNTGLRSLSLPFIGMGFEVDQSTGQLKKDQNGQNIFNTNTLIGYIFGSTSDPNGSSNLPNQLTQITVTGNYDVPNNAFFGCSRLNTINLSNEVKKIGDYAFSGCNINSINLPTQLEALGEGAFMDCARLSSIVIPSGVDTIENRTFAGCTSLSSANIANVTLIGAKVFDKCARLSEIIISDDNPNYRFVVTEIVEGNKTNKSLVLYTKDMSELIMYLSQSSTSSFTIPSEVKYIHAGAFTECRSLRNLVIPSTVTEIAEQAIVSCSRLESLSIPFVGNKAEAENPYFECIFGGEKPESLEVEVLSGTTIANEAFINVSYLTSIKFNAELESIGNNAFVNCSLLSSIVFDTTSNKLELIGNRAFSGCSGITSLELPSSIKFIGEYAFADCSRVSSISIPLSVETIGVGAFRNWSSLQTLNISTEHPKYKLEEGALLSKDGTQLVLYVAGDSKESYTVSNSVTTINPYAFSGANNLKEVVIPNTINELPEGLFYNCRNLQTITLPNTTQTISTRMFENCSSLVTVNNISNVTRVEESAFNGCSRLESIPLNSNTTFIGENAFEGCTSISSVTIPSSITHLPKGLFKSCTSLVEVIFPEGLIEIGESAFEGCTSIANFVLPTTLEIIGNAAFNRCSSTGLTKVIIPDSVSVIGSQAFNQCTRITYVYIPETVVSVGSEAFANLYLANILTNAITFTVTQEGNKAYTLPTDWAANFDNTSDRKRVNGEFVVIDGLLISIETAKGADDKDVQYGEVVGYIGTNENVVIPSSITVNEAEISVTTIAQQAFVDSKTIKTVVIPSSITKANRDLFVGCTLLEQINCEAESQPETWDNNWNSTNKTVNWGQK